MFHVKHPRRTTLVDVSAHFWIETHARSVSDRWSTPTDFFSVLNDEFGFTLDVCALSTSAKCAAWYGPDHPDISRRNGLLQRWAEDAQGGTAWMNPPYGKDIGRWMLKARSEAAAGLRIVSLVPARTDTNWWHDYVWEPYTAGNGDVRFVRQRLRFGDADRQAPFPSAVVVMEPSATGLPSSLFDTNREAP